METDAIDLSDAVPGEPLRLTPPAAGEIPQLDQGEAVDEGGHRVTPRCTATLDLFGEK